MFDVLVVLCFPLFANCCCITISSHDIVYATDDESGDSSFFIFVLLLPAFELFLCSRNIAAATADNNVVDYSICDMN